MQIDKIKEQQSRLDMREYGKYVERGTLPKRLESLRHQFPWPIETEKGNFDLSYFGEPRRDTLNKMIPGEDYPGIRFFLRQEVDIYAEKGVPVRSICSGVIKFVREMTIYRPLVDIYIYSKEHDLFFVYGHLGRDTIPAKIENVLNGKNERELEISQGGAIGEIGDFYKGCTDNGSNNRFSYPKRKLARKKHFTKGNHLHLEIHDARGGELRELGKMAYFKKESSKYPQYLEPPESTINPLLLLKRLN